MRNTTSWLASAFASVVNHQMLLFGLLLCFFQISNTFILIPALHSGIFESRLTLPDSCSLNVARARENQFLPRNEKGGGKVSKAFSHRAGDMTETTMTALLATTLLTLPQNCISNFFHELQTQSFPWLCWSFVESAATHIYIIHMVCDTLGR